VDTDPPHPSPLDTDIAGRIATGSRAARGMARGTPPLAAFTGSVEEYLHRASPVWSLVGQVPFHLAENKRSPEAPFAFLATYTTGVSTTGKVQHAPLGQALREFAGARNRAALLSLLAPVQRAAERCPWVKALVDAGAIYRALGWSPPRRCGCCGTSRHRGDRSRPEAGDLVGGTDRSSKMVVHTSVETRRAMRPPLLQQIAAAATSQKPRRRVLAVAGTLIWDEPEASVVRSHEASESLAGGARRASRFHGRPTLSAEDVVDEEPAVRERRGGDVPAPAYDVTLLVTLAAWGAIDLHRIGPAVDDPHLGHACPRIHGQLSAAVMAQRRIGHLHEEQRVLAPCGKTSRGLGSIGSRATIPAWRQRADTRKNAPATAGGLCDTTNLTQLDASESTMVALRRWKHSIPVLPCKLRTSNRDSLRDLGRFGRSPLDHGQL